MHRQGGNKKGMKLLEAVLETVINGRMILTFFIYKYDVVGA
jgi:hypothetical protein